VPAGVVDEDVQLSVPALDGVEGRLDALRLADGLDRTDGGHATFHGRRRIFEYWRGKAPRVRLA
jgi:hypothetical protein